MTKLKILFLFSLFPFILHAQWIHEDLLSNPSLDSSHSNKFSFQADIIGFFKNNEYSTPFVKGETFPGIKFIPKLGYQLDNRFRFEIGSSGQYYSGDQEAFGKRLFNAVYIRMQYAISPNFNFIIGNYYGGVNHQLIEPLYRWEKHFIDSPESGLQLLYKDQKYFADLWVNWQRFIERNDPLQEVLTFGLSSSMKLSKAESNFQVEIPLQLVINHKGGQIDVSDSRNLVIGNLVTGVKSKYLIDHNFFDAIGLDFYFAGYYDKIPIKEIRPYDSGWGLYPVLSVEASGFKFMTGYWYAEHFYSVEGESLFASFNHLYADEKIPTRKIITNKLSYTRKLFNHLSMGLQAETYADIDRGKIDYSFGVHLKFDLPPIKWK